MRTSRDGKEFELFSETSIDLKGLHVLFMSLQKSYKMIITRFVWKTYTVIHISIKNANEIQNKYITIVNC